MGHNIDIERKKKAHHEEKLNKKSKYYNFEKKQV